MDIAYFLLQKLELVPRPYQVIEHVPNLGLVKVLVQVVTVLYFAAQHKLELRVYYLKGYKLDNYLGKSTASTQPSLFESLGLWNQKKLLTFCVVNFVQVCHPLIVLVFVNDVAGDFHLRKLFVLTVLILLGPFE